MKNKNPFLLLFLLTNCILIGQGRRDFNFKFDGVDRNFVLSVPTGAVPAGGYPMVMMLHGTSGDGDKFYTISGWKELGEKEKFISVFPSSLEYCFIGTQGFKNITSKWNNGEAQSVKCPNLVQDFKDDVKFLRKVVDTVKRLYTINNSKVYISGFSNGSAMTNKLAIEMSDVFSAAASSGGLMSSLDSAKPKRYIPIWETIGTHDNFLIENLGRALPFNDSLNDYISAFTSVYRGVENLANKYKLNKTSITYTYIFDQPNSNTQKNYLYYTFIKDMEHVFPNGLNYPFSAPIQYWEFFKQASAISTPIQALDTHKDIQVFPNPASNIINIKTSGNHIQSNVELVIIDLLGKIQLKTRVNQELNQVNISALPSGMYKLHLHTKDGFTVKSFIKN